MFEAVDVTRVKKNHQMKIMKFLAFNFHLSSQLQDIMLYYQYTIDMDLENPERLLQRLRVASIS